MTVDSPKHDGDELRLRVRRALRAAIQEALQYHKRVGNPVAIWRDGKVAWVDPRDIPDELP